MTSKQEIKPQQKVKRIAKRLWGQEKYGLSALFKGRCVHLVCL